MAASFQLIGGSCNLRGLQRQLMQSHPFPRPLVCWLYAPTSHRRVTNTPIDA